MLLLASVHVHQPSESTTIDCYACQHHIHHDGHLSTTTFSIDNCLLCHFLTTPFVAAAAVAIVLSAYIVVKANRRCCDRIMVACHDAIRLRAPPVCG